MVCEQCKLKCAFDRPECRKVNILILIIKNNPQKQASWFLKSYPNPPQHFWYICINMKRYINIVKVSMCNVHIYVLEKDNWDADNRKQQ